MSARGLKSQVSGAKLKVKLCRSGVLAKKRENSSVGGSSSDMEVHGNSRPGFEVQDDLGNTLHLARAQAQMSSDAAAVNRGQASEANQSQLVPRMLDLNIPDLNEEPMPPIESSVGPSSQSVSLHKNFEKWVKIVFELERESYITSEFRQRFLTWYGLTCSEQERRVANTFFTVLGNDPKNLAAQLLDSFNEIIPHKNQKWDEDHTETGV